MLRRILLLVAVLFLVWRVLLAFGKKLSKQTRPPFYKPKWYEDPERLVQCSRCGIMVPAARAVMRDGQVYCSKKCAEADK